MERRGLEQVLLVIVVLASAVLIALNWAVYPLGNGRDEDDHMRLMNFYAEQSRAPHLPDDLEMASVQGHQPPLYYGLMAALLRAGLPDPQPELYERNPFHLAQNYNPDIPYYSRTLFVQNWPSGADHIRGGQILRGLALLMVVTGLGFSYAAMQTLSNSPSVAILGLALMTLTPSFWRTAIPINNNALLFMLAGIISYQLARGLKLGWDMRRGIMLGVLLGLGMLTKFYMLPLLGVTLLLLIWARQIKLALVVGLIVLILAGGWYARNWELYRDISAAGITEEILQSRRAEPLTPSEIGASFVWGWAGELWTESWTVLNTAQARDTANAIGLGLMLLGGLALWRSKRAQEASIKGARAMIALTSMAVLFWAVLGEVRNLHAAYSPPLLLVGLPMLYLWMAWGVVGWIPQRYQARASLSAICLILALTAVYHALIFSPQFPLLQKFDAANSAKANLNQPIIFENGVQLIGYEQPQPYALPGDWLRIKLCWAAGEDLRRDQPYVFTLKLVLPNMPTAAQLDGYHLSGRYPTPAWEAGRGFCEWLPLHISETAITARAYDVYVGMYSLEDEQLIGYYGWDGEPRYYLSLGKIAIAEAAPQEIHSDQIEHEALLEDWALLLSTDLISYPDRAVLWVEWLALKPTEREQYYSLQALDAEGRLIAQYDTSPLGGEYPTTHWVGGTRFEDRLALNLPPEAASLQFVVYDTVIERRAVWHLGDGQTSDALHWELETGD